MFEQSLFVLRWDEDEQVETFSECMEFTRVRGATTGLPDSFPFHQKARSFDKIHLKILLDKTT